jgi:hypothetical protein
MKRCPACGSTFTDDSLRFCLQDGAALFSVSDPPQDYNLAETLRDDSQVHRSEPPPTEKFNLGAAPTIRTGPAAATVPVRKRPSTNETGDKPVRAGRSNAVVVAGVTAAVVLLLVLTGFGIVYLLRDKTPGGANRTAGDNTTAGNTTPDNTAARNPANLNTANTPANTNANRANANANQSNAGGVRADSPVKITATASSTRAPLRDITYEPGNVLDGSLLTAWIEGAAGPGTGEWLRCDFDREVKLRRVLITPGYFKSTELWAQNNRLAAATLYFSDGSSRRFTFPDRMQEQRLDTGNVKTRWVRLVIEDIYPGTVDPEDTPISQLTFEFQD